MLKNPYADVNWSTFERLQGNTHNHLFEQWHVDNMYANGGRFIGAHPHYGKPLFPLSEHGMSVPSGAIEYSLAEHYGNTDTPNAHIVGIGSTLVTDEGEPHSGFEGTAFEFLDAIRATLQVSDGGGVHWNHPGAITPAPGNSDLQWMMRMYDYAPDIFLGVEFYNNSQGKTYEGKEPFMKAWWDTLLKSGRHVWGFANPDYEARRLDPYPDWEGKQIYLIPERTREACLRAIRRGQFFCVLKNTGFGFEKIEHSGDTVKVQLNDWGDLSFVTATRKVDLISVLKGELTITESDVYVRMEAKQGDEQIFSQPLMYDRVITPTTTSKRLVNNRSVLI